MNINFDYTNSIEIIRLTFIIGLILSLFVRRSIGFNAGGIIVPGFLAITLAHSPLLFVLSILISVLIYLLYKYAFAKKPLTGRMPVLIKIIMSVILVELLGFIGINFKILNIGDLGYIGYIVPGLIASTYRRHGDLRVFIATILTSAVTYVIGVILYNLLPLNTTNFLSTLIQQNNYTPYNMEGKYIFFLISAVIAVIAYMWKRSRIGGIVVAPLIVDLILSGIFNFLIFLTIVLIAYFLVKLMMKYTQLIGIERFVFATIIGIVLTWITEIFLLNMKVPFPPLLLTTLFMPIAVGSWINDITLQEHKKSALLFTLSTSIILAIKLILVYLNIMPIN